MRGPVVGREHRVFGIRGRLVHYVLSEKLQHCICVWRRVGPQTRLLGWVYPQPRPECFMWFAALFKHQASRIKLRCHSVSDPSRTCVQGSSRGVWGADVCSFGRYSEELNSSRQCLFKISPKAEHREHRRPSSKEQSTAVSKSNAVRRRTDYSICQYGPPFSFLYSERERSIDL
jgi:hypothetical protein